MTSGPTSDASDGPDAQPPDLKARRVASLMLIFAAGYLLSTLLRGVTAVLAPMLTQAFGMSPAELGLLAGSYFASFALMQLPMGAFLDRFGVRVVLTGSLTIAALSCFIFASAQSFQGLFWGRLLCGVGVSACLIAPLAAARLWTPPAQQQRINNWMLMSGALGLVIGTLPAEIIATNHGWRPLFVGLGLCFAAVSVVIALSVPGHRRPASSGAGFLASYGVIVRNRHLWRIGPLGLFNYGVLVAVQTLWVGPWLTDVTGASTRSASLGLFSLNAITLVVFLVMGSVSPRIIGSAEAADALLRRFTPVSILLLLVIALLGADADWYLLALYCVAAWPISVTHPLVGQRFRAGEAGRAIAFFNLLVFIGAFAWQWGFGAVVSGLAPTFGTDLAYRVAMGTMAALSAFGYGAFILTARPQLGEIDPTSARLSAGSTGRDPHRPRGT